MIVVVDHCVGADLFHVAVATIDQIVKAEELGAGEVDFVDADGEVLDDIGFDVIMDVQAEYALGGAERGRAELTLPRRLVLGALKRDVLTVRTALAQSGSGIVV